MQQRRLWLLGSQKPQSKYFIFHDFTYTHLHHYYFYGYCTFRMTFTRCSHIGRMPCLHYCYYIIPALNFLCLIITLHSPSWQLHTACFLLIGRAESRAATFKSPLEHLAQAWADRSNSGLWEVFEKHQSNRKHGIYIDEAVMVNIHTALAALHLLLSWNVAN